MELGRARQNSPGFGIVQIKTLLLSSMSWSWAQQLGDGQLLMAVPLLFSTKGQVTPVLTLLGDMYPNMGLLAAPVMHQVSHPKVHDLTLA